jgi:hypothetical protein
MTPDIGLNPTFVAVYPGIFPEPLAPKPMAVLEFTQLKLVAVTPLVKVVAGTVTPLQYVAFGTALTVGIGLTVILKLAGVPTQELADGVTVTIPVTGEAPVLLEVKEAMFPSPEAPKPIVAFELVQLKLVPVTLPEKVVAGTVAP